MSVELPVEPAKVWAWVADPARLPRWWPSVDRVDRPIESEYTRWIRSPRGRAVPMRFRLTDLQPGAKATWSQDLANTAFERSVRSSEETIEVSGSSRGTTVRLTIARKMKGTARLGGVFVARGQKRELEAAAAGLEGAFA